MNRNARRISKANHGARPVCHTHRRQRRKAEHRRSKSKK